jgi:5-methylcytosine-specific restriction endonuclease McrA
VVTDQELAAFDSAANAMGCPPRVRQPLHDQLIRTFLVADLEWAMTVARALVQLDRRVLLPGTMGARDSRRIPQDVMAAVWQRCQGRCVQCGADSYLEFDHIIPLSKGGATSMGNLQLLPTAAACRWFDKSYGSVRIRTESA